MDDKEEDTIEYDYRNTYQYKPERNGPGLTGNEIVTVAHPLLLAMILSVNVDRPELLTFIQTAVNGLLHNPQDIFFTGRLWDLLYDGVVLDCSSEDFEVNAVCSEFDSGDYAEIRRINETAFSFSMFGNVSLFNIFYQFEFFRRLFLYFSIICSRTGRVLVVLNRFVVRKISETLVVLLNTTV